MDIIDLLQDYYDREMDNVFRYAANWIMTEPRKGYEAEFHEARRRAEIIRQELAAKGVDV